MRPAAPAYRTLCRARPWRRPWGRRVENSLGLRFVWRWLICGLIALAHSCSWRSGGAMGRASCAWRRTSRRDRRRRVSQDDTLETLEKLEPYYPARIPTPCLQNGNVILRLAVLISQREFGSSGGRSASFPLAWATPVVSSRRVCKKPATKSQLYAISRARWEPAHETHENEHRPRWRRRETGRPVLPCVQTFAGGENISIACGPNRRT